MTASSRAERVLLDGENPPSPAASEDRPGGKASEKSEARTGEASDEIRGVRLRDGREGFGADDAVGLDAKDGLEMTNRPRNPGIDGIIE
jgi:hypothetical protein